MKDHLSSSSRPRACPAAAITVIDEETGQVVYPTLVDADGAADQAPHHVGEAAAAAPITTWRPPEKSAPRPVKTVISAPMANRPGHAEAGLAMAAGGR